MKVSPYAPTEPSFLGAGFPGPVSRSLTDPEAGPC